MTQKKAALKNMLPVKRLDINTHLFWKYPEVRAVLIERIMATLSRHKNNQSPEYRNILTCTLVAIFSREALAGMDFEWK